MTARLSSRTLGLLAGVFGLLGAGSAFAADPVNIGKVSDINSGDTAWMLDQRRPGAHDDRPGPGAVLRRPGSPEERAGHHDAELHPDGGRQRRLGGRRLQPRVRRGQPVHRRVPLRVPARASAPRPCEYAATIPHTTWMVYQLMFAIITPALICGAYAERMKFSAMLLFSIALAAADLLPDGPHGLGQGRPVQRASYGGNVPALDFAGGTVVHISSGVSALVCAPGAGQAPRLRQDPDAAAQRGAQRDRRGAAVGRLVRLQRRQRPGGQRPGQQRLRRTRTSPPPPPTLGWMFVEWLKTGKPTVLGAISGAVAGLVVITPASGFVTPMYAHRSWA